VAVQPARQRLGRPSGPGNRPARRLSANERRRQLLAVALRLFATRGYEATTMDHIADAAGVTKPLLYQHFSSKRALYVELVDAVTAELLAAIEKATSSAGGPRRQVEEGFAAYFRMVVTHETAFRLLYGRGRPTHPELGYALRRVEDAIAEAIDPLIAAGLDDEHRRFLAYAVVGMAEGASRHWIETQQERAPALRAGDQLTAARHGAGQTREAKDAADARDADSRAEVETQSEEAKRLAQRIANLAWAGLRAIHPD
jgi:AcrR family transcriptional regulator